MLKTIKKFTIFLIFYMAFQILAVNIFGLKSMDFIWNFGNAHDIANGYLPYNDFNMLVFPLQGFIMSLFAKTDLQYVIWGSFLNSIMYSYISLEIIKRSNKKYSILTILLILFKICAITYFNYNSTMILLLVIAFIMFLNYTEKNKSIYLFSTGLFLSLALITKQSVPGLTILLVTPIIFVYCIKNKKIKDFLLYAMGGLLPAILLIVFAYCSGFLENMINFSILEMFTFVSIKNTHYSYFLIMPMIIFFTIKSCIAFIENKKIEQLIHACFIFASVIFLNLQDLEHNLEILMLIFPVYVLLRPEVKIFEKIKNIKIKKYSKILVSFISIILTLSCLLSIIIPYTYQLIMGAITPTSYLNSKALIMKQYGYSTIEYIETIDEYMNNRPDEKIALISEITKSFSVATGRHYGRLDMMLISNGGPNETEVAIKNLYKYDKLIINKTGSYWSNLEVYKYIENNFEIIDTIIIEDKKYPVYKVK